MKTAIIAPVHIQPSDAWITALEDEADRSKSTVIIVDDSDGKVRLPFEHVYDYAKQRKELGDELYAQFEIFHHCSACKQFGLWLAYRDGYDVAIVIDSDCIVPEGFVQAHLDALNEKGDGWLNPLDATGMYSRGFPYSKRGLKKWAHMGLWTNELDLYGKDRVGAKDLPTQPAFDGAYETCGTYMPLSGMNVSFVREAIPYMLFLPNFSSGNKKFTRHDDIWGGYIFQKIANARNKSLSFGTPWVFHDTVVVPEEDAKAEQAMIKYEDEFYEFIDDAFITSYWKEDTARIFENLGFFLGEVERFSGLEAPCMFWANALAAI